MIIGRLLIRHYGASRLFGIFRLKGGFHLELFWLTFIYPISKDWYVSLKREYFKNGE